MSVEGIVTKTVAGVVSNDKTIEKASSGISKLFPYMGLKKTAVDNYVETIKASDLPLETKTYLLINGKQIIKKMNNQNSIATIALESVEDVKDFSLQNDVSEEWIDRFMDSAGFVSSEEMQIIWGKILAEEFKNPGSTPTAMTRVLSEITPRLAKIFRLICSMKVIIVPLRQDGEIDENMISCAVLVPFTKQNKKFEELGIEYRDLSELETLGLLRFNSMGSFISKEEKNALLYVGNKLFMINENPFEGLPMGNVMLTLVGEALSRITEDAILDDYDNMIEKYYIDNRCKIMVNSDYNIDVNENEFNITRKDV